ncbi:CRISPR-associated endonuclease/helicase Cas3 [Stackebrandtia soli]
MVAVLRWFVRVGLTVSMTHSQHRWSGAALSRRSGVVWGKSKRDSDDWLPLWRHLADSAQVAELLWDRWVPDRVRTLIADVAGDMDSGRRLVSWLAGVHDIGKATPSFTNQAPQLAERGDIHGLVWTSNRELYPRAAKHATTGQLILNAWLADRHAWRKRQYQQFSCVVGGHHGAPPDSAMIQEVENWSVSHPMGWSYDGDETPWRRTQWELLDWAAESSGIADDLRRWATTTVPKATQVLLTAIVIIADWIASNEDYFPYLSIEHDPSNEDRIAVGWRKAALPPRWRAAAVPKDPSELFRARFNPEHRPHPVQVAAVSIAVSLTEPALIIVEAPMGEGKTEAALAIAEIVAERGGDGGVLLALPTRATSDAVLTRAEEWVAKLAEQADTPLDLMLGHAKNRHNKDFRRLLGAGYSCIDTDWGVEKPGAHRTTPRVAAHRWMAGRKKTLLSQFAVVTIDQLLFAALKMKHVALRHLGLAGKVVVIDEAHAYDVYMSQYLEMAIEWIAHYGCTVVVLSATLPSDTRDRLVRAYRDKLSAQDEGALADVGYPTIVTASRNGEIVVRDADPASDRSVDVDIEFLADDDQVLADKLNVALRDGGCVLVIRNTVARAQATARMLREKIGDRVDVRLAHSRFLTFDRSSNDTWLRDTFGRTRAIVTPPTIVVATQVAEQSLDIDFDLLVTDLAPTDLMLQRLGRTHRHDRRATGDRPMALRRPRCLVTGAMWDQSPIAPNRGSTRVYDEYLLLRSAAVLFDHCRERGNIVRLPADISPLVQRTYGDADVGPADWQPHLARTKTRFQAIQERKAQDAREFRIDGPVGRTLIGFLSSGVGDADERPSGYAQVRDGGDSVEVIVVVERDESWFVPDWIEDGLAGAEIPREADPGHELGRVVSQCTIVLPFWLNAEQVVEELDQRYFPVAWQENHWLAGELVMPLEADDMAITLAGHRVTYSPQDGLTVAKLDQANRARKAPQK